MARYRVEGRKLTWVWGFVEAESEKEAVEKAWAGEWDGEADTDPGGNIDKRRWKAEQQD
jgi:hypothetical protein